jgi:hypothetical protein
MSQAARVAHWVPTYVPAVGNMIATVAAPNANNVVDTHFTMPPGASGSASPGTALPLADGTAAVGSSVAFAREDHVHPTDTSRAALASPAFSGNPTAPTPTAGDADTSIATTAFVGTAITNAAVPPPATVAPLITAQRLLAHDQIRARIISTRSTHRVAKAGDTITGDLTCLMPTCASISTNRPPRISIDHGSTNGVNRCG